MNFWGITQNLVMRKAMLTKTFAFKISFLKSLYIHALQSFILPTQKQNALFIYLFIYFIQQGDNARSKRA